MHDEFVAKVRGFIRHYVSPGSTLLLALSGGPDSTALLIGLAGLQTELQFQLLACHVNHKLRAEESDDDEEFCRRVCKIIGVPLDVYVDTSEESIAEADLRERRYALLSQCALARGTNAVVVAHSQDDQVETLLFRLFRGTSISGLTSMQPVKQMREIFLLRPLLNCTRLEIESFLGRCEFDARFDSSNNDNDYARNFLRNVLIPLCQTRFPRMKVQVERLRQTAECEDDFMNRAVAVVFDAIGGAQSDTWEIALLSTAHEALRRRVVAQSLASRAIEVSFERVQMILDMMSGPGGVPASIGYDRVSLNKFWDVEIRNGHLKWIDKQLLDSNFPRLVNFVLKYPGSTILLPLGRSLSIREYTTSSEDSSAPVQFPEKHELSAIVDLSLVSLPLVFRNRQPGDKIMPLGMNSHVRLKKFLHTHKAHADSSLQNMVLADQNEILWVPGVGLSELLRVKGVRPTHRIDIVELDQSTNLA